MASSSGSAGVGNGWRSVAVSEWNWELVAVVCVGFRLCELGSSVVSELGCNGGVVCVATVWIESGVGVWIAVVVGVGLLLL